MTFLKNHYFKISLLIFLLMIFCAQILTIAIYDESEAIEDNSISLGLEEKKDIVEVSEDILVEVKGKVKKTGIYEMKKDNTVNDAILAAGLSKDSFTDNINLSQKVIPQMVIYIYSKTEYQKLKKDPSYEICYINGYEISPCVNAGLSVIVSDEEKEPTIFSASKTNENSSSSSNNSPKNVIVNLNTADKSTLMMLKGIGEAKAEAIIEYRKANGTFKNIDELKNVKGIGEAIFTNIKQYLKV